MMQSHPRRILKQLAQTFGEKISTLIETREPDFVESGDDEAEEQKYEDDGDCNFESSGTKHGRLV